MKPTHVVYFVQGESDPASPVKIGHSGIAGFVSRLGSIQTGNPLKLCVRGVLYFEGKAAAYAAEKALHSKLQAHRMAGEWFGCAPLVLAEIALADKFAWPRCARCDVKMGLAGGVRMCQPCAASVAGRNRYLSLKRTEGSPKRLIPRKGG